MKPSLATGDPTRRPPDNPLALLISRPSDRVSVCAPPIYYGTSSSVIPEVIPSGQVYADLIQIYYSLPSFYISKYPIWLILVFKFII